MTGREHPVGVGVVGYGYWGPNLVRNFMAASSDRARVVMVCDSREERLENAKRMNPSIAVTANYDAMLSDASIDLIAIATPVSSHFALAERALLAGKHVLVEKPLTTTSQEAHRLVGLAEERGLRLFVDHTFVFTPAIQKMRELLDRGEIGKALYYDSTRINLGIFQHDVDVVWDLVPHDLAILDFLFAGKMPTSVSCTGLAHYGELADLAYVTLYYPDGFIVHVNVNWLAPVKIRSILLCGDRKMIVYDEHTVQEKVRVYDRGVSVRSNEELYEKLIQYRDGDMFAPRLSSTEALSAEVENVIGTLRGEVEPMVDGHAGLRVVHILEAATQSMRDRGRPVDIQVPVHA